MPDNVKFSALTRSSGAFAMLAIDQRESMRVMFANTQREPVSDAQITAFKLAALRALTPLASAVLIDRQFAWREAIDQHAVAPGCGLIAAADHFIPSNEEIVSNVIIDDEVDPQQVKQDGAAALKLLRGGPHLLLALPLWLGSGKASLGPIYRELSRQAELLREDYLQTTQALAQMMYLIVFKL